MNKKSFNVLYQLGYKLQTRHVFISTYILYYCTTIKKALSPTKLRQEFLLLLQYLGLRHSLELSLVLPVDPHGLSWAIRALEPLTGHQPGTWRCRGARQARRSKHTKRKMEKKWIEEGVLWWKRKETFKIKCFKSPYDHLQQYIDLYPCWSQVYEQLQVRSVQVHVSP